MRIGVNIPDELLGRFEPLRSQVNISQVCRETIQTMVEKYERNIVRLDDVEIEEALRSISQQEIEWMQIVDVDWEQMGYEDAENWIRAAEWEDWAQRQRTLAAIERQNQSDWRTQRPLLGGKRHRAKIFHDRLTEYLDRTREQSDEFSEWRYDNNLYLDVQAAERVYQRAWSTLVQAAEEKIRLAYREKYENLNRGKPQRPNPGLPAHLAADSR